MAEPTATRDAWLRDFAITAFARTPANDVTSTDVLSLLQDLEGRGLLETARWLRAKVSSVFRFGRATRRVKVGPT